MPQIGRPPCDDAAIRHGPQASACAPGAKRWTLVAAILGSSMAFIDGTVVNVALPALQRGLGANAFQAQWVVESYALFLAALLLVGGAFGDRFGRLRIYMIGVALFTVASVACGLSGSIQALIVSRCVQGVGAALLVPGSLALISTAFPESERGRAIGTWSACSGITAAIGPVVGGYLVDHFAWTWAFLVNAPIGAVLLLLCALKVPQSRAQASTAGVDVQGAVFATLGLGGLVFALIEAPSRGWTAWPVLGSALAGAVSVALFIRAETHGAAPMLPLGLFRNRNFAAANLLTLLLYAALGGGLYYLPLNLIQVQGLGATAAGAAMLPFIAIMFALSRWAGQLVDRHGPRPPLVIGPLIAALGFALFLLPGAQANVWLTFLPAICVLGLGMTITVAPLTTTVMNAVGGESAGVASGVNNAVSRTAALLAIAVFGLVMAWAFDAAMVAQASGGHWPAAVQAALAGQRDRLAGAVLPAGLDPAVAKSVEAAIAQSFVAGFRWVMAICTGLALASGSSAWWMVDAAAPAAQAKRPTADPSSPGVPP